MRFKFETIAWCRLKHHKLQTYYVVVDCDYSAIVNNLCNTQITDEVELDKSIQKWWRMS